MLTFSPSAKAVLTSTVLSVIAVESPAPNIVTSMLTPSPPPAREASTAVMLIVLSPNPVTVAVTPLPNALLASTVLSVIAVESVELAMRATRFTPSPPKAPEASTLARLIELAPGTLNRFTSTPVKPALLALSPSKLMTAEPDCGPTASMFTPLSVAPFTSTVFEINRRSPLGPTAMTSRPSPPAFVADTLSNWLTNRLRPPVGLMLIPSLVASLAETRLNLTSANDPAAPSRLMSTPSFAAMLNEDPLRTCTWVESVAPRPVTLTSRPSSPPALLASTLSMTTSLCPPVTLVKLTRVPKLPAPLAATFRSTTFSGIT